MFLQGNVKDLMGRRMMEMFQLSEKDLPAIIGVQSSDIIDGGSPEETAILKYRMKNGTVLNSENVSKFIDGIIDGNRYYLY